MDKLRWGILSTAKIATQKVIPAIQQSRRGNVEAIASRNFDRAKHVAETHQIPIPCAGYEDLIHLDSIDAVYIPLPNHLHVEWTSRAIRAGKHVLCEKPLGLNATDIENLLSISGMYPQQLVAEAFMYRHHPQWLRAHELIQSNAIGTLQNIHVHFSYRNSDPNNIRNKLEFGGGALMDVGCYGISAARWFYDAEPNRVCARMAHHPEFKTDTATTVLMDFEQGSATVVCGTQMQRFQHVALVGSRGKIILRSPFNLLQNEPANLELYQDREHCTYTLKPVNQFSEQCDAFAAAVHDGQPLCTPIRDSLKNMHVIDACFQSAQTSTWAPCEQMTDA